MRRPWNPLELPAAFRCRTLMVAMAALSLAAPAAAQTLTVDVPNSIVFPNYDRVPLGQREGLEAGAFVARTDDAAAAWYNPAGLVLSEKSGLNASATAYEWTTFSVDGFGTSASRSRLNSISTLVSGVVGAPIMPADWRLGLAIARPVSWRPGSLSEVAQYTSAESYEQLSFKALSDFSTQMGRIAVGWQAAPRLRLGAGLGLAWTSLSLDQGTTDHLVRGDSATTVSRRLSAEGTTYHLVGTFGAQWDPHPRWGLGVRASGPGWRLNGSTQLEYQGARSSESADAVLAIRDEQARFEYKLPAEVAAGLAYRFDRGALEVDARWHAATSMYDIYATDVVGTLTVDPADGPADIRDAVFAPTVFEARSVVNLAVGGRYALSPSWLLHAGFFTDRSPVAGEGGAFFPKIDFTGGTIGATLSGNHLSGSLGLGYTSGESDEVPIGTLLGGAPTTGRFKVSTLSLNYAISYAF